jgi:DNA-binding Lrp family transcriptional regulator
VDAESARPVDEVDLALLDALHVSPRASFERLGSALELSSSTVARRWRRLHASGRAWVSSVPGPNMALVAGAVDVRTVPGRAEAVGRALASHPHVASVYMTSGSFDLHCLLFAADMPRLSRDLLDVLPATDSITAVHTAVGLDWFSGVRWRLGAISDLQRRTVDDGGSGTDHPGHGANRTYTADEHALYLALQRDGRARYRDLARDLGSSEQLVKRRVASMVRREMLTFRTDFARGEGGWPAQVVLWLRVPNDDLARVAADIAELSQTRICMSTTGVSNLLVVAQLHQITDISLFLANLSSQFQSIAVDESRAVLRPLKSWGRIFDSRGHSVEVVPVDPWAVDTTQE